MESTQKNPPTYYVGIGASAGGLEALETLFANMPADDRLAFVVVQHLSPDYKSHMVELLARKTQIPVHSAEDGMVIQGNSIYVLPPRKTLTVFHGKIILRDQNLQQNLQRGISLPIDIFFRSLAEDQGEKAVGMVLSGTGSDGMRGVRAIKEAGGMVIVQDDKSAKFDGMPKSAISTGLADIISPVEEIPSQLIAFIDYPIHFAKEQVMGQSGQENGMTRIFSLLRDICKVDFTYYKPSTINRRIERRMTVNQIADIADYVAYLERNENEVTTLYKELLIGVTHFFRDPHVFKALSDEWLPKLFQADQEREFRFWVAGCSTGEEAYTLAIVARECAEKLHISPDIKIFATDIDRDAIINAQSGIYPESIAADLAPNLLAKYFYKKGESFQIARNIREMVVFAQHNLIQNPPFTNIDLISCRNLLIYFQPTIQKQALEQFGFSLATNGLLVLGPSETTSDHQHAFAAIDQKNRIYRLTHKDRTTHLDSNMQVSSPKSTREFLHPISDTVYRRSHQGVSENILTDRILQTLSDTYVPLCVVVNEKMEVLHVLGDTQGFFKLPSGKVQNDISKMADKNLAIPLSNGIQKVFRSQEEFTYVNIPIKSSDSNQNIKMRIIPLAHKRGQDQLAAVFIEPVKDQTPNTDLINTYDLTQEAEQHIRHLEQDLQFTRENLQATIEELETSNEELQATNEELLASNEELQSTNEELQSTNEELNTMNSEYQSQILELTELNNDVDNLLTHADIGKMLLDEDLSIRKFSPKMEEIFHIRDSDVGRPVEHLNHELENLDPIALIKEVIQTEIKIERDVRTKDGQWFLMRILPYSIGPESFSGVVLSFVDITQMKKMESEQKQNEEDYHRLFETMPQGIVLQNANGEIISANPAAEKILGQTLKDMQGRTSEDTRWQAVHEDGTPFEGKDHPAMMALNTSQAISKVIMGIHNPQHNTRRWISVTAVPLFLEIESKPYRVYTVFEDITDQFNNTESQK